MSRPHYFITERADKTLYVSCTLCGWARTRKDYFTAIEDADEHQESDHKV